MASVDAKRNTLAKKMPVNKNNNKEKKEKNNKENKENLNPNVKDRTEPSGARDEVTGIPNEQRTTFGKGATMPVLAADKYAQVILPNLSYLPSLSLANQFNNHESTVNSSYSGNVEVSIFA